jgi:molybdate transport system substrate-binding protein
MDVKATLAKVRLGEADAAVVYHSDVVAAKGAVTGIEVPASLNTVLRYPILRLDEKAAARAFVDFVMGADARRSLTASGLGSP